MLIYDYCPNSHEYNYFYICANHHDWVSTSIESYEDFDAFTTPKYALNDVQPIKEEMTFHNASQTSYKGPITRCWVPNEAEVEESH